MTTFHYQAMNRSGQTMTGEIQAIDETAARGALRQKGLFVKTLQAADSQVQSVESFPSVYSKLRLSSRQRLEFITQLATALGAHLPMLAALTVVGQQNPRRKIKRLVDELYGVIRAGHSMSGALGRYPLIFSPLDISIVQVGEASGRLDESVGHLSVLAQRDYDTRNGIITASLYPFFVLVLGIISIAIVVTWILPRIIETLSVDVVVLPLPTQMVLALGDFFRGYGWAVIVGLIAVFLAFARWKRSVSGRYWWDRFKLWLPLYGKLQRQWAVARFARTFGTLLRGGVGILEALRIVRSALGNEVLGREIDTLASHVRQGSSIAEPLRQSGAFSPLLVQVVSVGEQSGQLDTMLLQSAETFEKEQEQIIKRVMALFPAILILLLAFLVGFIVAATLLPIVQMETTLPR